MAKRKWWQYLAALFGFPIVSGKEDFYSSALGEAGNQIGSFINSKTGGHLTGAQQEANAFSARMAEEEYARQEEFYLKYQSPKAMLRQGVNPFGINGSAGGHVASGGAPSSVSPGAPQASNLFDIVQLIFGMQQQKRLNDSQIELNDSAARRNDAESKEREINAETLREMNATEILEKLSRIELNASNVQLITSKILNTDADTALKSEQLNKVVAEILNIQADTNVKAEQLNVMLAEIANMKADTAVKRQQVNNLIYEIVVERKQIEVFTAQIGLMSTQAGLNREMATKVDAEWRKLLQDTDHDEIMYGFQELLGRKEANVEGGYDPENYADKPVMRRIVNVLNLFDRMLDFSATKKF